jgi:two-component system, NtrC family, response regulator PilR
VSRAVLVVDDELGMRETLVDILDAAGYAVTQATDGGDALALARAQPFDVIVMDIRMPVLSGVEVLASLDHPPPQIVLMTAYAMEDELQDARTHDAFAIMQKPFHIPHLLQVVAEAAAAA